MNIDLNLYKVFFVVATYKNISHAADKLYISQPAVSKSIKNLETLLDITLFKRNSKGVSLTAEGNILFSQIQKAFHEIELGEEIIKKLKSKDLGTISIGISSILGKNYFLPKLKEFMIKYPNLKIKIMNTHTDNEINLVKSDKLDLAIVSEPIYDADIAFIKLEKVQDILVASKDYLKNNSISTLEDIYSKGSFMLLEKNNASRKHIDKYFLTQNISITPEIEASNMDFLIECAKMGLGITSVLKSLIYDDLKNGSLIEIPLESPIYSRYIGIAYKKSSVLSIASTTLIKFLS